MERVFDKAVGPARQIMSLLTLLSALALTLGAMALPALAQTPPPSPATAPAYDPVDTQPVSVSQGPMAFPAAAREDSVSARVLTKVLVQADGTEGDARVERVAVESRTGEALPGDNRYASAFAESALTGVRVWRFTPATKDGRAVAAWVTIPVRFKVR